MANPQPRIVTGQQIGAGWTPALSVVKGLQALALARKLGGEAVFWMADEDHDRLEVATTLGFQGERLRRHRFHFEAPPGTATGWLPWDSTHQAQAEALWGASPAPLRPTLREHFLALGAPLRALGLAFFSPVEPTLRNPVQEELERWRALDLESLLLRQAERLEAEDGIAPPLDPRIQGAWFSLDPRSGLRRRLEPRTPCPPGHWLSPGAALRPLLQSLLVPCTHVVLGPAESNYWRLTEPLWERVGLEPPVQVRRTTVHLVPPPLHLGPAELEAIRAGFWECFGEKTPSLPSHLLQDLRPHPDWDAGLAARFRNELAHTRHRLRKLDRQQLRNLAGQALGMDPERLRQRLFPLQKPQERVLPGLFWLQDEPLLHHLLKALGEAPPVLALTWPVS